MNRPRQPQTCSRPIYTRTLTGVHQQGPADYAQNFYLLCYAALLKNFTYYAQIMLIDIEQLPDIYSLIPMFCRYINSKYLKHI